MDPKTILIGNDHGGYDLIPHVLKFLGEKGIPAEHVGSYSGEIVRYPYYAAKVAGAVSRGEIERGILICSTGSVLSARLHDFR